jgi:hypothetical protein
MQKKVFLIRYSVIEESVIFGIAWILEANSWFCQVFLAVSLVFTKMICLHLNFDYIYIC